MRIGIALLLCLFPSVVFAQQASLSPRSFSFGAVQPGSTLTTTYWVRCIGPDSCLIVEEKLSCGCGSSRLENRLLAPGDSSAFLLSWRLADTDSLQQITAYLFLAQANRPMTVHAEANRPKAEQLVRLLPDELTLTPNRLSGTVALVNTGQSAFSLAVDGDRPNGFLLSYPDTLPASWSVLIRVEAERQNEERFASVTFSLATREKAELRITLPIVFQPKKKGNFLTKRH